MKQLLQNLGNGKISMAELPTPQCMQHHLLLESTVSLISPGTERMLLQFGQSSWFNKAKQQPEKVKQVLAKIQTDGIASTIDAVKSKLDTPLAMGYCNVGKVLETGQGCHDFSMGDRIVSNGHHAEFNLVPKNLCVKVPDEVSDTAASFAVLGAIALQGIRLAQPELGETILLQGLGLIGLLAAQCLIANGCRVIATDYDAPRLALAKQFGATVIDLTQNPSPTDSIQALTQGKGVDIALITTATASNDPIELASTACRQRGRIVLVGTSGLSLARRPFYDKELSFQVSCAYGPGRYDANYEQQGQDYPYGLVRWTAARNMSAFLQLIAAGKINTEALITHQFSFANAVDAYRQVLDNTQALAVLLTYPDKALNEKTIRIRQTSECTAHHRAVSVPSSSTTAHKPALVAIGTGNYATRILIPAFCKQGANITMTASQKGLSGWYTAKKFGISQTTTDASACLSREDIHGLIVATQHADHADWFCKAITHNKHLFLEKPLVINRCQLEQVHACIEASPVLPIIMVGFNRRFAPHSVLMKQQLASCTAPKTVLMTVNAGQLPAEHWLHSPEKGGGRMIGEACHFIDLARFLINHPVVNWQVMALPSESPADNACITLQYADGSLAQINYLSNGHPRIAKERIEVFCQGKTMQCDNFRRLHFKGFTPKRMHLWRQDKGQAACAQAFLHAIEQQQPSPIPLMELLEVAETCVSITEALQSPC